MLVEKTVFSLLQTHECVIVPGFGGFISKRKSANIDFTTGIATPPYKEIGFNIKLQDNDGVLINSYSAQHLLSYKESEQKINQQVSLEFVPVQEKSETVEILEINPKPARRNYIKYAAAAAIVLPLAFYSYWIPAKTPAFEAGMISYHDFNPLRKKESGKYAFQPIQLSSVDFHEELSVPMAQNPTPELQTSKVTQTETTAPITPVQMHLIAGCFSSANNAERLANKLNSLGFQATILHEGGLHKVSAGGAFSEEGLSSVKQKAQSLSIDLWLLKIK
ncbi:MAG: SPOR domain-containing protein [Flavobacteriia bacterium]|nr:SPOR domain-containing protein [Flavobacteriia bacterium]